ncbi:MAG: glycosyltransferase family 2 protein [Syntrophomonadaceae bacterium]|nr:glycosyltransferase family 2 protein [Syntrophomonadaceae bacterium]
MKSISIVVPAYNEAAKLAKTLKAIKTVPGIESIIVVNDGSSDNTAGIARKEGVRVIDLPANLGKGGAMNAALGTVNTDIIVFLDADLAESAAEVEKIIKPVLNGEADLCIASFPPARKKGGFGLVKKTARWAIRKAGGTEFISPLSGQRAMTREVVQQVAPFREKYGVELDMTIRALKAGFRIKEIPTFMAHNETGRDLKGFLHRGKQFLDVVKVIRQHFWRLI